MNLISALNPTAAAPMQAETAIGASPPPSAERLLAENQALRARLAQAEAALHALRGNLTPGSDGMTSMEADAPPTAPPDALLENEAPFRTLAESLPQIVWAADPDGANTYFNDRWCAYTGMTQQESRGAGWNLPFHPDDRQMAWSAWQRAIQGIAPYAIECRLRRADGAYRWWLVRGAPSLDAQQNIQQWLGTCTDIDDLKQAESALREHEARLRLATEAAGLGVWSWEPVADVVMWENGKVAEIVGLAAIDQAISAARFSEEFLHPDDRAACEQALARTVQQGEPLRFACRIRHPGGGWRVVAFTGAAMPAATGEPLRVIGTVLDVTERQRAAADLQQRHADAEFLSSLASRLVLRDLGGQPANTDRLLQTTVGTLAGKLGAELYFNYAAADELETLRLVSCAGVDAATRASLARVGFGDCLSGIVAQTRRPLVIDDLSTCNLPNSASLHAMGGQVYAGYPLLAADRLIGTMAFARTRHQPFLPRELELIQLAADLLAAAVEGDRLTARVRSSQARFRNVFKHAGTAIAISDIQGLLRAANPAYCTLLGYTFDELRLIGFSKLVHPEDREQNLAAVRRLLASRLPSREIESRYLRKDGSTVWVHKVLSVLRDEAGQGPSLVELVTDVTQRRAQEAQLQLSEEIFRSFFDNAAVGAAQLDPAGGFIRVNDRYCAIAGYDRAVLLAGLNAEEVVHPDDRAHQREALTALGSGNLAFHETEQRYLRKDGAVVWAHVTAAAVRDAAGGLRFIALVVQDITARRLAERALNDADRRKDEFLATLAHELRNPLAPVRSAVHVLHKLEPATPQTRWVAEVIDRQMAHLSRLIDDLMNVSRIKLGKIELHRQPVALAEVLRTAAETSQPLIDSMHHRLTLSLPPVDLMVNADATRLVQVFQNLLNNAAKYTDPGGRIELCVEKAEEQVSISISDTGIGLSADQLPTVFEMFSQVETALSRSRGGLGIGLFLVRRLV
ncbi:MAG: PAS domain S-box protein, partial [Polaromonas sp.]|nr:PAS domain S-box protein [Polaromonas sp.]